MLPRQGGKERQDNYIARHATIAIGEKPDKDKGRVRIITTVPTVISNAIAVPLVVANASAPAVAPWEKCTLRN